MEAAGKRIIQRATLLNTMLADLSGGQRLLRGDAPAATGV
jgi:uncharacterized circularly permuted ATP-grasp superfamily protein